MKRLTERNGKPPALEVPDVQGKRKQLLAAASVILNLLLFLIAFAWYPPVWATNDDYRMSVILSGAYLGKPSADAVFLQYPLGLLLSWLYSLLPAMPIYGIYTEMSMFISCCVICYALLDIAQRRGKTLLGLVAYLVLYALSLKKYTMMPQFTLTSAYLGIAAAVLVWRMPHSEGKCANVIFAVLLSLFSFLTRAKVFYLLVPVIGVMIISWWLTEKRLYRNHVLYILVTGVVLFASLMVNTAYWNRTEYAAYQEFNTARSRVYDYGEIPFFYDDQGFYVANGIDETLYRQIAARYLDMDVRMNADVLNAVADRIAETSRGNRSLIQRSAEAFAGSLSSWFASTDETVAFSAMFVLVMLAVYCVQMSHRTRSTDGPYQLQPQGVYIIILGGLLLETMYFLFIGRLMTRQLDTLLIAAAVFGTIMTMEQNSLRNGENDHQRERSPVQRLLRCTAVFAMIAVGVAGLAGADMALSANHTAAVNRNAKLETLQDYAAANPHSFYFYDTQYFIAATDDVFQVYDTDRPMNMESLGSWNVESPTYVVRNQMMGFSSAVEGLTRNDHVFFVAITEPSLAMTRTLKDHYNKKLVQVDRIQASNCILYIYCAVDDD